MIRRLSGIQKKLSLPGLAAGAACFCVAAVLIFGSLRLYELRQEIRARQKQIAELQEQVGSLRSQLACQEHDALQRVSQLGMLLPGEEDYVILHVGRSGTDAP